MTASGEGYIKISREDPSGFFKEALGEWRTEPLDVTTVASEMVQIPPDARSIPEDWKLVVEMKGDSATTADATGSTFRIPVRVRNISTKTIYDKDLSATDLGMSATDITVGTTYTRLGAYTVSAGEEIRFGKSVRANSQLYMSITYT